MTPRPTILTALVGALLLAGCLGNPDKVARWKQICTDQGYAEGTPEFDRCWEANRPRQIGGAVDRGGGP